jgi:AcrR family transcriptional regulator
MPFPRFEKLEPERRERLLDAAAREFAAHSFAGASINRILEQAQVSKGVAYYYIADKADLFAATIQYCSDRIALLDETLDPASLTADSYWPTFARLRREPLTRAFDRPWLFGALKALGQIEPATLMDGPLASYVARFQIYVLAMLRRGLALGVIRDDLPEELLLTWLQALDRGSDDWLLARWSELTPEEVARRSDQTVEAMRRAVAPDGSDLA